MDQSSVSAPKFRSAFVLILLLGVSLLFLAVAWPFLKALLVGALLAGLCHSIYNWLTRRVGDRRALAAVLTVFGLLILLFGPLSALVGVIIAQAAQVSEQAAPWLKQHLGPASGFDIHDWLVQRYPSIADYVPEQAKIVETAGKVTQSAGGLLVGGLSNLTAGTASFLLKLFVTFYAMFFFLRDGPQILTKTFYYIPLSDADEERLLDRITSITRATIKGTLVIGLIQGTLAGLGFWVAGIDGAVFWGTLMTVLSVVPGLGAAVIWVPGVIYLYITGHALAATLLMIWCAAVVGTVDNLLRPSLVGKDAELPDLLILIGTLGGLFLFGPIGFIVGPMVCGLFLTVLEIYGTTFRAVLPATKGFDPGGDQGSATAAEMAAEIQPLDPDV